MDERQITNRVKKTALLAVLLLLLTACGKSTEQQIVEQLELGQKYLAELDYEQAIVAFNKIIELDAKIEEGYLGLARAYKGIGSQKQAIDALELGTQSIGMEGVSEDYKDLMIDTYLFLAHENENSGDDASAEMYYDRILEISPNQEDALSQKKAFAARSEIAPYYEDIKKIASEIMVDDVSNIKGSLLFTEEFENAVKDLKSPVIYQADNGNYLGIYPGGYIYWGEMNNGIRDGNGLWFHTTLEDGVHSACYLYRGKWGNDFPNGHGEYLFISLEKSDYYVLKSIKTGNFIDGYFDGNVVVENIGWDGDIDTYDLVFDKGKPEIIDHKGEKCIYAYAREDGDKYLYGNGKTLWDVDGAAKE